MTSGESTFDRIFWDAVKSKSENRSDVSYLDLGGTSLGIFLFTENMRKELGIEVSPELMLSDDATLDQLKSKYLKEIM